MRHHNLPFRMAFELARFGLDAWIVVSLRALRLLPGAKFNGLGLSLESPHRRKTARSDEPALDLSDRD
jgi:hypothetical protein